MFLYNLFSQYVIRLAGSKYCTLAVRSRACAVLDRYEHWDRDFVGITREAWVWISCFILCSDVLSGGRTIVWVLIVSLRGTISELNSE